MSEPIRITAREAHDRIASGSALLVCAYEQDEKFNKNRLEGAISYVEFLQLKPGLQKDRDIILYCA